MIKKVLFMVLMVLVGVAGVSAYASHNDDYQVIQNAVKKNDGAPSWFRLEVTEKGKNKVQIKIPLSIAEMVADSCPEKASFDTHCKVDMKKVLTELKRAGSLVEITDEDATVRIWVE